MQNDAAETAASRHECQICEGCFTAKKGLLAKHGYKRPGDGFLHGECFGARRASYAVAVDALVEYAAIIGKMLEDADAAVARLAGEAPAFTRTTLEYAKDADGRLVLEYGRHVQRPLTVSYAAGVSAWLEYSRNLDRERGERGNAAGRLRAEADRVAARIAKFRARAAG